ncbi:MAG: Asp-tRNA(Asn)/Glu-tRNA(Gln) amidotransferase subunit GatC [Halobacteria archaeon]
MGGRKNGSDQAEGDKSGEDKSGGEESVHLDVEDVEHIADLCKINVDEEEAESFVEGFNEILNYFEKLDEAPEDIERGDELENVLRDDLVEVSLSHKEAVENAPETEEGYIKGPKVS